MFNFCCRFPCLAVARSSVDTDADRYLIYRKKNNTQLQDGYTFLISGKVIPGGNSFTIDYCLDNKNKDIALRIACIKSSETLICKSRFNYKWAPVGNSTSARVKFYNDWDFQIQVLFKSDFIYIAFDSMHVVKYAHRAPITFIDSLEIRGDIKDLNIDRTYLVEYPIRNTVSLHIARLGARYAQTGNTEDIDSIPGFCKENKFLPLPYYAIFERGFFAPNYMLNIKGFVSRQPQMIKIALQYSENYLPQPTIPMQIEFRFTKKIDGTYGDPLILLNTYVADKWVQEVQCDILAGLRPDSCLNLSIVRAKCVYQITMNNIKLFDYPYIVTPLYINTCLIEGDIQLLDVIIENNATDA